eukprot:gnl/TRDRNA2_/TRDRNA2_81782_c0_seq1.p1 gnl/TRDRNA2_/TRDRNA2_81782_c0~~gnl/TRDRNA2_/TRDRNA2_81782_c0_seq1.p1  ORF type:complete len:405 (-),score=63.23 gnl/TRDRNA2_/TRDRNA2_81782_c0_seq1:174-1322(-)
MGDKKDTKKEKEARIVVYFAVAVGMVGVLVICLAYRALTSPNLYFVDRLVHFNEAYEGEGGETAPFVWTTRMFFRLVLGVGVASVVFAVLGSVGSVMRNRVLVSAHVIFSLLIAIAMLSIAFMCIPRIELSKDTVTRQVTLYCKNPVYSSLVGELKCAGETSAEDAECGIICEKSKEIFTKLEVESPEEGVSGSCYLLGKLCKNFDYVEDKKVADWEIATATEKNLTVFSGEAISAEDCREKCDEDITCVEYYHTGSTNACLIATSDPAAYASPYKELNETAGEVTSAVTGGEGISRWTRTTPVALGRFDYYGKILVYSLLGCGVALALSLIFTWIYMFNLNFSSKSGARNKPDATTMIKKVFCACMDRDEEEDTSEYEPVA